MVWDPQKPKIGPLYPPMDPIWAHFVGILGQFGFKKTRSSQIFLLKIIFYRFPDGRGPSKTENCPFIPPNVRQMTYIGFPHGLGPSKHPKLVFYTPPIWAPPVATHPARSRKELSPIQTLVYVLYIHMDIYSVYASCANIVNYA